MRDPCHFFLTQRITHFSLLLVMNLTSATDRAASTDSSVMPACVDVLVLDLVAELILVPPAGSRAF